MYITFQTSILLSFLVCMWFFIFHRLSNYINEFHNNCEKNEFFCICKHCNQWTFSILCVYHKQWLQATKPCQALKAPFRLILGHIIDWSWQFFLLANPTLLCNVIVTSYFVMPYSYYNKEPFFFLETTKSLKGATYQYFLEWKYHFGLCIHFGVTINLVQIFW